MVVVAAGDEHLGLRAQRGARLAQEALRVRGRVAMRGLPQLQPVAEDDEPVHAAQALDQRRAQLGAPEQILAARGTEVEVRDDERAHATSVP